MIALLFSTDDQPYSVRLILARNFVHYLANKPLAHPYYYFVVRYASEKIVACGGMKLESANHSAMLRWDMVANDFQKHGIGTFLISSRLDLLNQNPEIKMVNLYTSQHSYLFYQKMGFALKHVIPNGIVDGMDEYYMELKLSNETN